ncbi:RHS repeat protein [Methylomonas methanica]|uniref:YD repeat-containing protein n=1 Tax=Methylomonas methanica (strain DSM 25384 / MC09) TaxID=857087 RepID=F9ZVL8_METMM|nr:RHS repeat protein [Methylomonas methanica]AEG02000.1 YD repeat-containing protein [Methylomonas methanica MC09]
MSGNSSGDRASCAFNGISAETSASSSGPSALVRLIPWALLGCFPLILSTSVYAGVEINYVYDDLNRLTSVARQDGPAITYQYDASGNFDTQGVSNSPDTDGDLVANFVDTDDDGDGMSDAFELQYGFDPLNAADATLDSDNDGISNLAEFQAGTNPLQSNTSTQVPALPDRGRMLWLLALSLFLLLASQSQKTKKGI